MLDVMKRLSAAKRFLAVKMVEVLLPDDPRPTTKKDGGN